MGLKGSMVCCCSKKGELGGDSGASAFVLHKNPHHVTNIAHDYLYLMDLLSFPEQVRHVESSVPFCQTPITMGVDIPLDLFAMTEFNGNNRIDS